MDAKKLKSAVDQAQEAVKDIQDESLKKIAFQKILDTLLTPPQASSAPVQEPYISPKSQTLVQSQEIAGNLTDLFAQKKPASHPDTALTIAYFMHFKGDGDFNVEDLLKAYSQLLIPKPKNPTDVINQNIRKRFIDKVNKQKNSKQAYHITKYGIDYVNNNFAGKSRSTVTKKKHVERKIKKSV